MQEANAIDKLKTNQSEIQKFIDELIAIIDSPDFNVDSSLFLNPGSKNMNTLSDLDYDTEDVLQRLMELEVREFTETKLDCGDTDPPLLYVFGKEIDGKLIYIKLKIRETVSRKKVICLSFHYAEESMTFPYR